MSVSGVPEALCLSQNTLRRCGLAHKRSVTTGQTHDAAEYGDLQEPSVPVDKHSTGWQAREEFPQSE